MNENDVVIQKNPQLPLAEDYYLLREQGLAHIEELGSAQWTDYNAHDPGITILEALCYTLSEAGYRTGFDIADILTEANGFIGLKQALFTARRILTNSALTVTDFRKVLVDMPGIRNGWLLCKNCACELTLYAECKESALFFAPLWRLQPPLRNERKQQPHEHPVFAHGLYDVLLELDEDPELGDLNDRKILHTVNYQVGTVIAPLTVEIRFPDWEAMQPEVFKRFTGGEAFLTDLTITRFSRDRVLVEPVDEASFVQGWRNLFFADFTVKFQENIAAIEETIHLTAATIRFFSPKDGIKRAVIVADLVNNVLAAFDKGSIADRYQRKLQQVRIAAEAATFALHGYRNLCEDFCRIEGVLVEDVAVCADVEVAPEADVEWVLANVYNEIELYFNPPVRFYTLRELEAEGMATDAIFEGPALENGFIKTEEMEASQLRSVIHVSDLLNRLMDIPGVIAVKDLRLTRYDREGNPILPEERWTINVSPRSIPRLYIEASRLLFYKNDLPFLPRMEEARAILAQLRGERERPKIPTAENDYPVPAGQWRDLSDYQPVQHEFPLTYGIGPHGLADEVTPLRKAQAHQMKGYLMVYEQLVANMLEQLAHTGELFSTDETSLHTYFTHYFDPAASPLEIAQLPDLLTGVATQANLNALVEPQEVFYDRRNRFLDHLLARFGEQFRDYALMLYSNADRIPFAPDKLIRDKARFLRDYPRVSSKRARAFNYRDQDRVCDPRNRAGLAERISRLLGMEMLRSYFSVTVSVGQQQFSAEFVLIHRDTGQVLLHSFQPIIKLAGAEAEEAAWLLIEDVIANSVDITRYTNVLGVDYLLDEQGNTIARVETGALVADVIAFTAEILEKERLYIVENLLLRPKFWGDAVMPVCLSSDCHLCGEEDPYSFLLTYVVQGDLAPFNYDIDLRRFADNTIRKETPAHLLPKICWVSDAKCKEEYTPEELEELGNQCKCPPDDGHCRQFSLFEDAWCAWLTVNAPFEWQQATNLLHRQVEVLLSKFAPPVKGKPAKPADHCTCSELLLGYFGNRFREWVEEMVDAAVDPLDAVVITQIETVVWKKFLEDIALIRQYDPAFCKTSGLPDQLTFWTALRDLLLPKYAQWLEVSYRLQVLIRIYTRLSSVYPAATLHDCDDGSDDNPVRLNNTILGSM